MRTKVDDADDGADAAVAAPEAAVDGEVAHIARVAWADDDAVEAADAAAAASDAGSEPPHAGRKKQIMAALAAADGGANMHGLAIGCTSVARPRPRCVNRSR